MDDTSATQMLSGTQATTALPQRERPRRQLEPLPDAPRRRRPEPAAPARGARRPAGPPPRERGGLRKWLILLLVLALIAGGAAIYSSAQSGVQQGVQLKRQISGKVNDAADQLKSLINDNTR
jgi:hypothetical protein